MKKGVDEKRSRELAESSSRRAHQYTHTKRTQPAYQCESEPKKKRKCSLCWWPDKRKEKRKKKRPREERWEKQERAPFALSLSLLFPWTHSRGSTDVGLFIRLVRPLIRSSDTRANESNSSLRGTQLYFWLDSSRYLIWKITLKKRQPRHIVTKREHFRSFFLLNDTRYLSSGRSNQLFFNILRSERFDWNNTSAMHMQSD